MRCHCWVQRWVQALLVTSGNVVAALVPIISSLVPSVMKLCVRLFSVCWRASRDGASSSGKELGSAPFSCTASHDSAFGGEVTPFTELFTGRAGQVSHNEP